MELNHSTPKDLQSFVQKIAPLLVKVKLTLLTFNQVKSSLEPIHIISDTLHFINGCLYLKWRNYILSFREIMVEFSLEIIYDLWKLPADKTNRRKLIKIHMG